MNIYISGISGTGMGPLALIAKDAGLSVQGSDLAAGPVLSELKQAEIPVKIGPQTGDFLKNCHEKQKIDWFIHTSALPADHKELKFARENNIKISKRDEFLAYLIDQLNLKLIAVAGTHGKTTTTSMLIWAAQKLNLPVAWLVGTTLPFTPAGSYHKGDKFFIYEADEYDRNFLAYHPWLTLIPFVSYDHPDIYKTKADYDAAFEQFKSQSEAVITPEDLPRYNITPDDFTLSGEVRRLDAALAASALAKITDQNVVPVLNSFPGTGRRFERLAPGLYSDYAHHPEEIAATLEIAREEAARTHKKGVVALYEPHQNIRQHEVLPGYHDAFKLADRLYWLPTYLVREDPNLKILTPEDFIKTLKNQEIAISAAPDAALAEKIKAHLKDDYLVLLMTAGPADLWLRQIAKTLQ